MLQLFSKMQDATLDAELHHEGLSLSPLSSFCGLPAGLRDRVHADADKTRRQEDYIIPASLVD